MITLLKSYLGYPQPLDNDDDDEEEYQNAHEIDLEPGPPSPDHLHPSSGRRPHNSRPVPLECDPDADIYDFWFEQFAVAPSRNGTSVVVFNTAFQSEVNDQPVFDDWGLRDDDPDGIARVWDTVKIYERLFSGPQSHHRRIAGYLGRAVSGYRLERLAPGPFPHTSFLPAPGENDVVLALYHRWALQVLSALRFVHSKGIVANAIWEDAFWLRPDLSIALACFLNAASVDGGVRAGLWGSSAMIDSQWGPGDGCIHPPGTEPGVGHLKRDIFDWAVMVYRWMSEGKSPLHERGNDVESEEPWALERAVEKGSFDKWPELGRRFLGPALLKAWRGEYESADEAFGDVRTMLVEAGRTLSADCDDEIVGLDWGECFRIESDEYGNNVLHLNRRDGKAGKES